MYIYRWDLDKTYLQTDFDSIRGLIRSATEPAYEKRNVPGSRALLRALSGHPSSRVIILSGSPTQLRDVLAEKLRLDGIRYEELHLKDNLDNLKRGRFRAVRGQFGYKLPMLLSGRVGVGAAVRESLFGDDAEVDAVVYSVFADAVAGRLRPVEVSRIMEAGGAYPDRIKAALAALERVSSADVVDRIFIHLDRGVPTERFDALGSRVVPVFSWFQAALVLFEEGRLSTGGVQAVAQEVFDAQALEFGALANHFQDIVRRGFVRPDTAERLVSMWEPAVLPELLQRCRSRVSWMSRSPVRPPGPLVPERIDYIKVLRVFGRKESKRDTPQEST